MLRHVITPPAGRHPGAGRGPGLTRKSFALMIGFGLSIPVLLRRHLGLGLVDQLARCWARSCATWSAAASGAILRHVADVSPGRAADDAPGTQGDHQTRPAA